MSIRRFIVNSSYVRTPFTVGRSFSVATSSSGGGASRYGEKKARVEPTPTSEFPLQNEGSKDSPPALGYNLVLQRMANIVLNVTDKQQPVKLLHVHPENALLLYMGKQSNVDMTGLSNSLPSKRDFKSKSKYAQIEYINSFADITTLPFRSSTFEVVLHCLPVLHLPEGYVAPSQDSTTIPLLSPPVLPLTEMVRILNNKGFLVLGYPEALWQSFDMQTAVDELTTGSKKQGELLIMQKVPLLLKDLEPWKDDESTADGENEPDLMEFDAPVSIATTRTANARYSSTSSIDPSTAPATPDSDKKSIKYLLAVFRKA